MTLHDAKLLVALVFFAYCVCVLLSLSLRQLWRSWLALCWGLLYPHCKEG